MFLISIHPVVSWCADEVKGEASTQPYLTSSLIGAIAALIVMILRDVVIENRRDRRRRRRTLVEQKLSHAYGPLWIAFGGDSGQLGNVLADKDARDRIGVIFHLLSADARRILGKSLRLGKFVRDRYEASLEEMEEIARLSTELKKILKKDMDELQHAFTSD